MRQVALAVLLCAIPAVAQVDQQRAAGYFREVAALCEREGGRLWGVSLCGPIAIRDAATNTIATNQPAPDAEPPAAMGFANTALEWGGARWTTVVWQMIPSDEHLRGRLFLHELFHRIQPQLGFVIRDGPNDHLDTLEGRYWLQLEWRALAQALGSSGEARKKAVRDALAFRQQRHKLFPGAAENERLLEINEGLAQYTGTVASAESPAAAAKSAIQQLGDAAKNASFVRTFPYPLGAAHGLLLDSWSPGWTHRVKQSDDLGAMLTAAAHLEPAADTPAAAARYGGAELRAAETRRDIEQQARIAELRRRFVEGPVLVLPRAGSYSFSTAGITPVPGAGTVYPNFGTSTDWGKLQAEQALVAADRSTVALPGPVKVDRSSLSGPGWTLQLAEGWTARPGPRPGDFQVAKQ